MISRRKSLKTIASGVVATLGSSLFPDLAQAVSPLSGGPKRVIFFLQNQGFDPATCIPAGMKHSGSLAKAKLRCLIYALLVVVHCSWSARFCSANQRMVDRHITRDGPIRPSIR